MKEIFAKKNTCILVGFVVLFKTFLSAVLELHPDEAYYWLWAKNLSYGYFDHSPMVAYFIKATTLFSNSEIFVRFSSIIVTILLSILLWKFAKKLFNEKVAAASVMIINTLPLMLVASIIITPDTPLFLFWAFSIYFLWKLVETNQTKYWYLTGLFFGLSLLSKYMGVLFAPCLLIYMIIDKKLYWFKNKHFYGMLLLAFLVFLPVIIWNYNHDWISFLYQLDHGLVRSKPKIYLFDYLGGQCLVAGPVIFIAGLAAAFSYWKNKDSKKTFLLSFSIPIILFFAITAFKKNPGANWPATAYFTFSIMVAQYLLSGSVAKKKILTAGIIINIVASVIVGLHVKYSVIPIAKFSKDAAVADATNWFMGWSELGEDLLKRDIKYAIADSHQRGAIVEYYTKGKIPVFLDTARLNQYAYWPVAKDLDSAKTAIVYIDHRMESDYTTLKNADISLVYRNGVPVRQYAVIETSGYIMQKNPVANLQKAKK